MGRLHFQHHDGDDDSKNSVTESLEAALIHTVRELRAERLADRVEQTYTGITAVVQVWLSRVRKIASAGLAQ